MEFRTKGYINYNSEVLIDLGFELSGVHNLLCSLSFWDCFFVALRSMPDHNWH